MHLLHRRDGGSGYRRIDNEVNPTEVVPTDLYPLKQRAHRISRLA